MILCRFPGLPTDGELQWERIELPFVPGQTLEKYLGIEFEKLLLVVSSAIGAIGTEKFDTYIPQDGDEIHVVPFVGGKNRGTIIGILAVVAAVAFTVATYGSGWASVPAAWSMLASNAALGYSLGSSLAALTAAHPRVKDGDKTSMSYTWDGITNADHPGVPDPVVMGDHRTGGVRVSAFIRLGLFFDASASPAVTRMGERGNILLYVSKDRIEAITDVRVNNTPITNFPGASYAYTLGEDPEQWYGSSIGSITNLSTIGLTVTATTALSQPHNLTTGQTVTISGAWPNGYNGSYTVTVIDPSTFSYQLAGAFAPGGGLNPPSSSPRFLIDNTPIPRPSGFDAIANTYTATTEITLTPYVYTTQPGFLCDAVEIIVAFPTGIFNGTSKGDRDNTSRYMIKYRALGSGVWIPFIKNADLNGVRTIKRTDRAPYFEAVRIDHLAPGRYEIQLTFVSADSTDATKDAWKPFLSGVTEEQQTFTAKPGKALLAVQALSVEALNGSLEGTIIDCRCKGIRVPWHDGVSWQPPTWYGPSPATPIGRNPGWLVCQALRNRSTYNPDGSINYRAWGLGDDIPDTNIFTSGWKKFADKCSALVTVTPMDELGNALGAPYTEPKHSLDIVLNQQRPALDMIAELLATARAARMMDGNGTQWGVFYDDNDSAVQLFTMGNIVQGSLSIHRDFSARSNTFDVTFVDRANDFATSTREVVNTHLVNTLGKPVKRDAMSLVGVTGWPNTYREAGFALRKIEAIGKVIEFDAATDAILMRVGQVFNFQHERPQWGFGGRVRDDAVTSLGVVIPNTLTATVSNTRARSDGLGNIFIQNTNGETLLDLGVRSWEVRVRYQDGSAEAGEIQAIQSASVSANGWLVLSVVAFSQAPKLYDLLAFGPVGKSVKPWRCIAITRSATGARHITGTEFNSTIYPDDGIVQIHDYSSLPKYGKLPPPVTDLAVFEDLSLQNNSATNSTVKLQWARPKLTPGFGFTKGYLVEKSEDGLSFQLLASVEQATEYRWTNAPQEVPLWFRVTPYSVGGVSHDGAAIVGPLTCHGKIGEFLRTSDDRNVTAIAESFDGSALPLGFSISGSSINFEGSGQLTMVTIAGQDLVLTWDVGAWSAGAGDPSKPLLDQVLTFFNGFVIVRITALAAVLTRSIRPRIETTQAGGAGPATTVAFDLLDDQKMHSYRISAVDLPSKTSWVKLVIPTGILPGGTTVSITAIAAGIESIDQSLDGYVDRAQRARNQFDKDPTGLGLRMLAPVRSVNDIGNVTIVNQNGIYYLDNGSGQLSGGYKRITRSIVRGFFKDDLVFWADLNPPLRFASLMPSNKLTVILEAIDYGPYGGQILASTDYPVRQYLEPVETTSGRFRVGQETLIRGSANSARYAVPYGPAFANKRSITEQNLPQGNGGAFNSGASGWFAFSDGVAAGQTRVLTASTSWHVYRRVIGIKVQMPNVRKATGDPYYVTLQMTMAYGQLNAANPLSPVFFGGYSNVGSYFFKFLTDGTVQNAEMVLSGRFGTHGGPDTNGMDVKVDWLATTIETGGGSGCSPTAANGGYVELDTVDMHYVESNSLTVSAISNVGQNASVLFLESF